MIEEWLVWTKGGCPDYVKLAESYGAQGIRAQSMDELG